MKPAIARASSPRPCHQTSHHQQKRPSSSLHLNRHISYNNSINAGKNVNYSQQHYQQSRYYASHYMQPLSSSASSSVSSSPLPLRSSALLFSLTRLPSLHKGLTAPCNSASSLSLSALLSPSHSKRLYSATNEQSSVFSERTWKDLGLNEDLIRRLKARGVDVPTKIQERVIPEIEKGKRAILIQSQTGTGKTLAYTLPMVQMINWGEAYSALILVPTEELGLQIRSELIDITSSPAQSVYFIPEERIQPHSASMQNIARLKPAILIATPTSFLPFLDSSLFHTMVNALKFVIIDEADSLITSLSKFVQQRARDKSAQRELFQQASHETESDTNTEHTGKEKRSATSEVTETIQSRPAESILDMIYSKNKDIQLICASATLSAGTKLQISKKQWFQDPIIVRASDEEKDTAGIPTHIQHKYAACGLRNKTGVLSALLKHFNRPPSLVLAHPDAPLEDLVTTLKMKGIKAKLLNPDFLADPVNRAQFMEAWKNNEFSAIVCHMHKIRGMDFKGIQYVFLMTTPSSHKEYLHLAGRTGRLGRQGTAITIVAQGKELERYKKLMRFLRLNPLYIARDEEGEQEERADALDSEGKIDWRKPRASKILSNETLLDPEMRAELEKEFGNLDRFTVFSGKEAEDVYKQVLELYETGTEKVQVQTEEGLLDAVVIAEGEDDGSLDKEPDLETMPEVPQQELYQPATNIISPPDTMDQKLQNHEGTKKDESQASETPRQSPEEREKTRQRREKAGKKITKQTPTAKKPSIRHKWQK